jgi:hypothetical protein
MTGIRKARRRRLRRWRPRILRPIYPGIAMRIVMRAPVLLVLAYIAGIPTSALAEPSLRGHWDPPRTVSIGRSAPLSLAATAGLAPDGEGVVLWHSAAGVEAVLRPSGRGFGAPRAIAGSRFSMADLQPRLAFDGQGGALALWAYFVPHPQFVQDGYSVDYTFGLRVAARGPNSAFGRAQTLTDNLDADPSADVAIDPRGNAVVVWTDEAGMHAAARPAGKRRFEHAKVISQTQADPQVAVGTKGSASAAWVAGRDGDWSVRAATSDTGEGFGRASALPIAGLGDAKPVVALDGRSAVTAAWATTRGRVMAATCSAAGHCGRARPLSPAGETATDPHVAVAADGSAVVAWRTADAVEASLRHGHAPFKPAVALTKLADGTKATGLTVGIGARGDAAALWTLHTADGDQVVAALRHGAGRFAHAYALTPKVPGAAWSDPQVVLGPVGQALAVWGAMTDGHPSIQAASYDR